MRGAQARGLGRPSREHVRVQGWLEVAEDRVIDAHRAGQIAQRSAQAGHVREKCRLPRRRQRIQVRDDGIRQQQAIARDHLRIAHHGPARIEPRDECRVRAVATSGNTPMDRGHLRNTK